MAKRGVWAVRAALLLGLAYAAISVYWAAGGLWLVDTVSGALAQQVQAGTVGGLVVMATWAAAGLKVIAALLPWLAVRTRYSAAPIARAWQPRLRTMAWLEAAALTAYGLILTSAGLLVESGLITAAPGADQRALAWHAFLWDPWFLLWGLLVALGLLLSRELQPRAEP